MSRPPFERTVCACEACVANCKRWPGPLAPHDLGPIFDKIIDDGKSPPDLLQASAGALVARRSDRVPFRVGTIVPKMKDGRCVFLNSDDRCSIHVIAPMGCAHFDSHMSKEEADRRSTWMHSRILESPGYAKIRSVIGAIGGVVDPLKEMIPQEQVMESIEAIKRSDRVITFKRGPKTP